jgi:Transglycosylase SLT domain
MARMKRIPLGACARALAWLLVTACSAQLARAETDTVPLLQQALRVRVTIWHNTRTGFLKPAFHCRRASEGCDRRLYEFAQYLNDAGERYGIDPWLLAAMAFRESGLNPFAVGAVGELGILQLHPRNPGSKHLRFIRDEWYRQRCHREPGACQREIVERAAAMLAESLRRCGGDLDEALGMYNTGHCGGNTRYAQRIMTERERMQIAVGLKVEPPVVQIRALDQAESSVTPGAADFHTASVR